MNKYKKFDFSSKNQKFVFPQDTFYHKLYVTSNRNIENILLAYTYLYI